jgi:hypothetical protein
MKKHILAITLSMFLVGCGGSGGSSGSTSDSAGGSGGKTGKGGSMARFAISGDYLYTLNKREITAFDISSPDHPLPYTKDDVPWDVETLFSYGDYLFVGAEGGVYVYNKPTPSSGMELKSTYSHVKSCDPIVIDDGGIAYVTLNNGSSCRVQGGRNALEVLDVKDPLNLKITKNSNGVENSHNMIDPKGLGVDNNILFVCDGVGGLKVFDINKTENNETNETRVDLRFNRESTIDEVDCYDVIPYNKNLIVSNGKDVRQYDYTQLPMVELGRIK